MIRTGEQYQDSIRDGREVYVNCERVKDVTKHPQFKPLLDEALLPTENQLRLAQIRRMRRKSWNAGRGPRNVN